MPVAVAVLVGVWFLVIAPPGPLDLNRFVVFPLEVSGESTAGEAAHGEDNAWLIWNALDGRVSLRWLNALHLVDDPEEASTMSARRRRALARTNGSGFYVHGRVMLLPGDSFVPSYSELVGNRLGHPMVQH